MNARVPLYRASTTAAPLRGVSRETLIAGMVKTLVPLYQEQPTALA